MTDVSFLLAALLVGGFLAGLGFWLAVLGVILGLSAVLWALIRFGAH